MAQATEKLPADYEQSDPDRGAVIKIIALMLGIALPAVLGFALWTAVSAQKARDDAQKATAGAVAPAATGHEAMSGTATAPLQSYAGTAPVNADALADAHVP
jgi:hypothetical protein